MTTPRPNACEVEAHPWRRRTGPPLTPFPCFIPSGKYIGNRPVKLRKSTWQQRDVKTLKKKERKEKKMVKKLAATVVAPQ